MVADRIRFGLAAVKNVGGSALDSIMEVRGKDGPFCSLTDFCSRVDLRRVNRRVIESLIKAGAFDSFGTRRSQLFAALDQALDQAQSIQKEKMSGQMSLFSIMPAEVKTKNQSIPLPDIEEWPEKMRLAFEKETVGFYLTGHPLNDFKKEIAMVADVDLSGLAEWPDNHPVRVGGLVRTCKEHKLSLIHI